MCAILASLSNTPLPFFGFAVLLCFLKYHLVYFCIVYSVGGHKCRCGIDVDLMWSQMFLKFLNFFVFKCNVLFFPCYLYQFLTSFLRNVLRGRCFFSAAFRATTGFRHSFTCFGLFSMVDCFFSQLTILLWVSLWRLLFDFFFGKLNLSSDCNIATYLSFCLNGNFTSCLYLIFFPWCLVNLPFSGRWILSFSDHKVIWTLRHKNFS